jgi:ABC-2 type transport system permease protein
MLVLCLVVVSHGGDAMQLIIGPANPMSLVLGMFVSIPVYALWALPTAGWLLLCSAWARSKPFLWAVMLPLFAGIIVSTTKLMHLFDLTTGWFWQHIVGRLLLGAMPGMDLLYRAGDESRQDLNSIVALMSPAAQLKSLAMPGLWIGAAFGVVFIFIAIRLRKRAGEI